MPRSPLFTLILVLALVGATGCGQRKEKERALRAELRKALREHDYAKAVPLAQRNLEHAPEENGAWDRLVRAQLGAGKLEEARQALVDWRTRVPHPSAKLEELTGDLALRENDPERALAAWTKALTQVPRNVRICRKIALLHRAQGQWAEEEAMWTRIIDTESSGPAFMGRALARRHLHRWPEALEDAQHAAKMAPDDPEVHRGVRLFERLTKFLGEIRELDARLAIAPNDDQTLTDRALLFLRSDDAELALADGVLAASKAPWAVRPKLFQALALLSLGRPEEVRALEVEPTLRLSALTPEMLETISRLDSEISLEPTNADLRMNRAWQLNDLGQPRLALQDAEAALHEDAKSAGASAERSYALMKLGRPDEALEEIKRATEADPKYATAWQYRGELEFARRDFATAVESLTQAINLTPTSAALQKREEAYRELGEAAKAEQDHKARETLNAP